MPQNIETLILEQLRAMRASINRVDDGLPDLTVRVGQSRGTPTGIRRDMSIPHADIAITHKRLDRLESRLERIESVWTWLADAFRLASPAASLISMTGRSNFGPDNTVPPSAPPTAPPSPRSPDDCNRIRGFRRHGHSRIPLRCVRARLACGLRARRRRVRQMEIRPVPSRRTQNQAQG